MLREVAEDTVAIALSLKDTLDCLKCLLEKMQIEGWLVNWQQLEMKEGIYMSLGKNYHHFYWFTPSLIEQIFPVSSFIFCFIS